MLKKFEDILAQCIDDIKVGRSSIEDCLDRYPSLREQLEPLLRIALDIREAPDVKPSPAFKVKARVRLMDQIHDRQAVTRWPWLRYNNQTKQIPMRRRFSTVSSMASIIVAIVVALSALGGGVAYASQGSLPGDTLYTVKLATEQIGMMLPGDDVASAERALGFADRRIEEMETLAEKGRLQDLALAVEKYDDAMNMVAAKIERAGDKGLFTVDIAALVGNATAEHLSVLDRVYDMVPNEEAKAAITRAREVSLTGQQNALAALAKQNPVGATEINLAAMNGRLNRVGAMAEQDDIEGVENALEQFEAMAEFGEEISQIAQEVGMNITKVAELVAAATSMHLEVLAEAWERASEQARPAIEEALANSLMRHQRVREALEQRGIDIPPAVVSERIRERVEERIQEQRDGMPGGTVPPGVPGGVPSGRT